MKLVLSKMMGTRFLTLFILTMCLDFSNTMAAVKLPKLISDGMVLQRDKNILVWGWANPGEKVSIVFNSNTYTAITNGLGKWRATIAPQKAGGPYVMEIKGTNEIEIKDILVGEVWICSGQSNMVFKMEKAKKRYAKEIQESTNPSIRQFCVDPKLSAQKLDEVYSTTGWKSADPQSVLSFTAAGYFFAKKLYERYHVRNGSAGKPSLLHRLASEELLTQAYLAATGLGTLSLHINILSPCICAFAQ